jgi:hypothetical protein
VCSFWWWRWLAVSRRPDSTPPDKRRKEPRWHTDGIPPCCERRAPLQHYGSSIDVAPMCPSSREYRRSRTCVASCSVSSGSHLPHLPCSSTMHSLTSSVGLFLLASGLSLHRDVLPSELNHPEAQLYRAIHPLHGRGRHRAQSPYQPPAVNGTNLIEEHH